MKDQVNKHVSLRTVLEEVFTPFLFNASIFQFWCWNLQIKMFSPTPAQRSLPPSSSFELGFELVQFETHRLVEERSQHDRRKSENVETWSRLECLFKKWKVPSWTGRLLHVKLRPLQVEIWITYKSGIEVWYTEYSGELEYQMSS